MTRIGVVGTGFMAEMHLEAYADIESAEVVAVASPNTAAEFVAEQGLDAETYASTDDLLAAADVDAIDVCTPTHTHRGIVTTAAKAGVAVFCEKPISNSLDDAAAIAAAVEDAGIPFMVGHVLRFFPAYETLRETVESGGVGKPGVVRARRLSPFPGWGAGDWYADDSNTGGILTDLAIHDLDYLRWVLGPVEDVFARSSGGTAKHAHVTLRFESGAVGYVEASWAHPESVGLTSELEIAGDDGLVEYDSTDPAAVTMATDEAVETTNPLVRDGYRRQLEAFLDAVETGKPAPVGAEEAIEALRLAKAAQASTERGEPVAPAEVNG